MSSKKKSKIRNNKPRPRVYVIGYDLEDLIDRNFRISIPMPKPQAEIPQEEPDTEEGQDEDDLRS